MTCSHRSVQRWQSKIWESILNAVDTNAPIELESDGTFVWQGLASLDAPDAKLYMYRVESQWYIDYRKTVDTFPKVKAPAIAEPFGSVGTESEY